MNQLIAPLANALTPSLTIGQIANGVAAQFAFADYRSRKAPNTLTRQEALHNFMTI